MSIERSRGRYGPYAATSVVVANMIGTGVFTSLGFQLLDIQSTFPLLLLWVVGGAAAFCGAISYARTGRGDPPLGRRVHVPVARPITRRRDSSRGSSRRPSGSPPPPRSPPSPSAPTSRRSSPPLSPTWLGAGLVVAMAAVHVTNHRSSGLLQSGFTTLKVALIVAFCLAAATLADPAQPVALAPAPGDGALVFGGAFAVSLIYVSYAYTGWNAATYLTGEVDDPQRTIPRILASGTLLVTVLYVALNYAFLRAAPMAELEGRLEVGYVAATHLFGPAGAAIMGVTLAVLLVSTVSAMVLAGPRVLQVMGEDYPALRRLARTKPNGIPAVAVLAQAALTLAFIVTASFETILVFAGFILGLNSLLTVAGVFVLRMREPSLGRPYRTWGFPITPLVYLGLTSWTLVYIAIDRPVEALAAAALIAGGLLLYRLARSGRHPPSPAHRPGA